MYNLTLKSIFDIYIIVLMLNYDIRMLNNHIVLSCGTYDYVLTASGWEHAEKNL